VGLLGLALLAGALVIDVVVDAYQRARDRGLDNREAERSRARLMHELRRRPRDGG
jgi:hypothetical protein